MLSPVPSSERLLEPAAHGYTPGEDEGAGKEWTG